MTRRTVAARVDALEDQNASGAADHLAVCDAVARLSKADRDAIASLLDGAHGRELTPTDLEAVRDILDHA